MSRFYCIQGPGGVAMAGHYETWRELGYDKTRMFLSLFASLFRMFEIHSRGADLRDTIELRSTLISRASLLGDASQIISEMVETWRAEYCYGIRRVYENEPGESAIGVNMSVLVSDPKPLPNVASLGLPGLSGPDGVSMEVTLKISLQFDEERYAASLKKREAEKTAKDHPESQRRRPG